MVEYNVAPKARPPMPPMMLVDTVPHFVDRIEWHESRGWVCFLGSKPGSPYLATTLQESRTWYTSGMTFTPVWETNEPSPVRSAGDSICDSSQFGRVCVP